MQIYAEYLFAENFTAGIIILLLLGKMTKNKVSMGRLFEGGVFCGLYSFIIFCNALGSVVAILCKILFSIFIVINTFPVYFSMQNSKKSLIQRLKCLIRLATLFFIISFALGGMVIAGIYITGTRGITKNTAFYTGEITYLSVFAGLLAGYLIFSLGMNWMRQKRLEDAIFSKVSVSMSGKEWDMNAMLDTGNMLTEPISGRPVCVLWGHYAKEIMAFAEQERFCIIPYRTLGKKGTLQGIRIDRLIVEGKTIEKVVLGVYDEEICKNGRERYDLILNRAMLEGGIEIDV